MNKYFFPHNFIDLLDRRLGLGPRLILITILNTGVLGELQFLMGIVKLFLLSIFFTMEVRSSLLSILACRGLRYLDLSVRILFESDSSSKTIESW